MPVRNYGFIVKAPGYDADSYHAVIANPLFRTEVVCVETLPDAQRTAARMVTSGVDAIELCGGFSEEDAQALIDALATDVPIGRVTFPALEHAKLTVLLQKT